MLTIKIQTNALPLNRLYPTNKSGRRFLSKEGSDYKKIVHVETYRAVREQGFSFNPKTHYLSSEIFFYTPKLITKKKEISKAKPDTSNLVKALEDAVFEVLGIDDCYNLDLNISVHYSKDPLIVFILRKHLLSSKFDSMGD